MKIAVYLRLSSEDSNVGESNSIKNQRDLLKDFIGKNANLKNGEIIEFCDDGYSGTNLERPSIKRMLEETRQGKINCIIVKDFSRFSRNYIDIGGYLETVFPFLNIRFISVNDNYDSNDNLGSTNDMGVVFKTLIYDLYSKDLSMKIKSGRLAKVKKGEHLCKIAPFGYAKSKTAKNKLVVDVEAAEIVKRVFQLAGNSMDFTEIAMVLNSECVPTPLMYRKQNNTHIGRGWSAAGEINYWTKANILRILRNEVYLGKIVSGKRENIAVGSKKTKVVAKENWLIVPNAHEAIITEDEFEKANMPLKPYKQRKPMQFKENLFNRKVKCGHCSRTLRHQLTKEPYFYCETGRYTPNSICNDDRILEKTINDLLTISLKNQMQVVLDMQKSLDKSTEQVLIKISSIKEQIKDSQNEIEKIKLSQITSFENYSDNKISKDEYIQIKLNYSNRIDELTYKISNLNDELENANNVAESDKSINKWDKYIKQDNLTKELMADLVESITVYDSEHIEVKFKFADEYIKK